MGLVISDQWSQTKNCWVYGSSQQMLI